MANDLIYGYSREDLDAQYDLRGRVPEHPEFLSLYDSLSDDARRTLPVELDVAYGSSPGERMDIFPAATPGAPVHMFIHGGYWRSLDKSNFDFVALGIAPADVTVAVINYDLAPGADMDEIVRQCRAAAVWLHDHAGSWNGDGSNLHISGHSAGGHLAAMLMATDWPGFTDNRVLPGLIRSVVALSGLFDTEVMRFTYLNADLGLDSHSAIRNSPLRLAPHTPKPQVPVHLTVGMNETDEFHRHMGQYAAALDSAGVSVSAETLPDHHHFSIITELANPQSSLTLRLLSLMRDDA